MDLRDLLREVESLMRPQAQLKSLALHIDADPGVPEKVRADRTRVKQILFNLVNNAVKFSDRGVVVVDLHRASADDGSEQLEFVVTDTGIGMDQATLDRLFKRFSQGDESRSRRHGGTGLGLEISRSLARLMGGDVTAKSVPGEGSSFSFRMPLHAIAPAPKRRSVRSCGGRPGTGGAASLRVLVAEDHPVNRQYMAALLEGMGHRPFFAGNGLEAVQAIREQRFDIVLMDLHMPLLDGVGATLSIRAPARRRGRHRADHRAHRRRLRADARALPDGRHERLPGQAGQPGPAVGHVPPPVRRRRQRGADAASARGDLQPSDGLAVGAGPGHARRRLARHAARTPGAPAAAASSRRARRWSSGCASRCATARRWTCASMPTRRAARR